MVHGTQDPSSTASSSSNQAIVATTLATVLLAGSAYLWRSSKTLTLPLTASRREINEKSPERRETGKDPRFLAGPRVGLIGLSTTTANGIASPVDAAHLDVDLRDSKSPRPKERRRRKKDPLKEMLKGAKKSKVISQLEKPVAETDTSHNAPSFIPHGSDPTRSKSSRATSVATSSRSLSPSHSSAQKPEDETATQDIVDGEESEAGSHLAPLHPEISSSSSAHTPSRLGSPSAMSHASHDQAAEGCQAATIFGSSSSLASHESSSLGYPDAIITQDSTLTPATTAEVNATSTPTYLQSSQSLPIYSTPYSPALNRSSPMLASLSVPWDGGITSLDPTSQKPPRFRSKPRSIPAPLVTPSTTMSSSRSTTQNLRSNGRIPTSPGSPNIMQSVPGDASPVFTFPSLNDAPTPFETLNHSTNSDAHEVTNGFHHLFGNTNPRNVTPRRTPTPSSRTSTPPPSLSAQTQIASFRGALEAARLREQKMKHEMERYAKEVELVRWESVAWRRREIELQTQIHNMAHQLQAYAALYASLQSQNQLNHLTSGVGSPNPSSSSHIPSSNPQSPHAHMQSPNQTLSNGLPPVSGLMSPVLMSNSVPQSPFFGYPAHPQQHPHMPAHNSPNLFNILFPPSTPGINGSQTSSATGSSVGSASPDMRGLSPGPASFGRGRQRNRTRLSNGQFSARGETWDELGDGWYGLEEDEREREEGTAPRNHVAEYGTGDSIEDDGGFSGVLADAILKRPESIRVGSRKGKSRDDANIEPERHLGFSYPSLSNFGNGGNSTDASQQSQDDVSVSPNTSVESDTTVLERRPETSNPAVQAETERLSLDQEEEGSGVNTSEEQSDE